MGRRVVTTARGEHTPAPDQSDPGADTPRPVEDAWRLAGGLDVSAAHPARVYDYWLGGKDNFAADRDLAERAVAAYPPIRDLARENRKFLVRAVQFAAAQGIQQFIDIGAGFPTTGDLPNTHQAAHQVAPQARVLYVDNDPMVVVHARALLAVHNRTSTVEGDLRDPESILRNPELRAAIDLTRPVAILLVAILHFVRDEEDPYGIVRTLVEAMAPDSYLILAHGSPDFASREAAAAGKTLYDERATAPLVLRTRAQITRFLDGLELVEPGLVQLPHWRPDGIVPSALNRISAYGAVGYKCT
jgi:S-adenosyl methyltransferase